MRFNSTISEEPYQGLKYLLKSGGNVGPLTRTVSTGAAWLSSARALKCSLKWGNERNPYSVLQVSPRTAQPKEWKKFYFSGWEEGGDDVKSAWPFDALGYTRVTMAQTMGCQAVRRS